MSDFSETFKAAVNEEGWAGVKLAEASIEVIKADILEAVRAGKTSGSSKSIVLDNLTPIQQEAFLRRVRKLLGPDFSVITCGPGRFECVPGGPTSEGAKIPCYFW